MSIDSHTNQHTDDSGASLGVPLPIGDDDLFKHTASSHILNFLADNPDLDFPIGELTRVTPVTERATREAVDALEAHDLVDIYHKGNARRVHINRARLHNPRDPIERIPQPTYRTPVRIAQQYIDNELADVLGIILFGSVARGEADRQSDIDLWILVDDDFLEQRNTANALARALEETPIPASIGHDRAEPGAIETHWEDIRDRLENDDHDWPNADRHAFEFVVETPQSILQQSTRVEPQQLFGEGITLYTSETLDRVKREVLQDE
jgi:predicted nucleotidyltransferase